MQDWSVYILECSDGTYYTGITNNLEKRIRIHNSGKGARYTSKRVPVKCIYSQNGYTQGEARQEEIILKDWSRKKKRKLINGAFDRTSRLRSKWMERSHSGLVQRSWKPPELQGSRGFESHPLRHVTNCKAIWTWQSRVNSDLLRDANVVCIMFTYCKA